MAFSMAFAVLTNSVKLQISVHYFVCCQGTFDFICGCKTLCCLVIISFPFLLFFVTLFIFVCLFLGRGYLFCLFVCFFVCLFVVVVVFFVFLSVFLVFFVFAFFRAFRWRFRWRFRC